MVSTGPEVYEGRSSESFEAAVLDALRDAPGTNEPVPYGVTLGYTSPGGINPQHEFRATLTPLLT